MKGFHCRIAEIKLPEAVIQKRCVALSAIIAIMALSGASCNNGDHPGIRPSSSEESAETYANVWSAEPETDLFSRGAELVRATFEAGSLTYYVGFTRSFPGYVRALDGAGTRVDSDFREQYRALGGREPIGVSYDHIIDYAADSSAIKATVCTINSFSGEPGKPLSASSHVHAYNVELYNTAAAPGLPGVRDGQDTAHRNNPGQPIPSWDVFGTWRVAKFGAPPDGSVEPYNRCSAWWAEYFPALKFVPESGVSVPSEFSDTHEPVKAQYPKWIAPAGGG